MNPRIPHIVLLLPFAAVLAQPLKAQNVIPPPGPPITRVAAGEQAATAQYQCVAKSKDGAVQRTFVEADSPEKARRTAADKLGVRSKGVTEVSCARATGAAEAGPEARVPKEVAKTRAPTPPVYEPTRSGIRFEKDGSCKLSQAALSAHPDARSKCRERPGSEGGGGECPAEYCATLR